MEGISPLQTFQGDITRAVQDTGVSVVSIAASEAVRRSTQPLASGETAANTSRTWLFVVLGLVLLGSAGGLLAFVLLPKESLQQEQTGVAPFIAVDETHAVVLPANADPRTILTLLTSAKNKVSLSLGLVEQLYVERAATSSNGSPSYIAVPQLLSLVAPTLSEEFLRNTSPVYLLGVHAFGINQPFLLLKADSYEQAYAGMLAWEGSMHQDLSPLFSYAPVPTTQQPVPSISTSTASTTPQTPFVPSGFIDKIIANHDARVLQDQNGSVYFLWTFLDRHTLLITTNEATVREVVSRLLEAPITSLPPAH
jgi:hypothetical protein